MDGILNNDALKNNKGDQLNSTWTQLLRDLQCFEDVEDHINMMRRKWVIGASDWMAGNNGSKQNQKEVLDYTDVEWEYIWSTMMEDGAWAVPSLKDTSGNWLKDNCAPEMMIQYIAHDLRCHIVVFDLLLNTVQFISANHLKDDNVVFDSPLLIYSTGGHFQSVFPKSQEFFIQYANNLEELNTEPEAYNPFLNKKEESIKDATISGTNKNSLSSSLSPKNSSFNTAYSIFEQTETTPPNVEIKESFFRVKSNPSNKRRKGKISVDNGSIYNPVGIPNPISATESNGPSLKKNIQTKKRELDTGIKVSNKFNLFSKEYDDNVAETENIEELGPEIIFPSHLIVNSQNTLISYEEIRSIKPSNRTDEQRKYFEKIKKQKLRESETKEKKQQRIKNDQENRTNETKEKTEMRKSKDRIQKREKISNETKEETELKKSKDRIRKREEISNETSEKRETRNTKDKESQKQKRLHETQQEIEGRNTKTNYYKKQKRLNETEVEKKVRTYKNKMGMKKHRLNETANERLKRCLKNKENMRKLRCNRSQLKRLQKFQTSVRYGPIFTCTVCEQDMFRNSVVVLTKEFEEEVKKKSSEMFQKVFQKKYCTELNGESNVYICGTCKKHLKEGNLPAMAAANGLEVVSVPEDLNLTELENNLIAKRLIFQKIYQLPKSRMAACKDQLINIPIASNDIVNTLKSLPRTPQEAGLLEVKLKRKLDYKNTHKQAYIDPQKIYQALRFLKSTGHPDYQFYDDYKVYQKRCLQTRLEFVNDDIIEPIVEMSQFLESINNETAKENEENSDEEEVYMKKDVVRKYQFDYDKSVCLVDQFPEAAVPEEDVIENNQISFAPGEGKIPENILQTENWDRDAFPMKHPDGKNNLHQSRNKKLTDQYYFVQRLRNRNTRFSIDPAYTFAAAAYLEKKQLQGNINVSYLRGKETRSKDGVSTFHLEDGFSVFDKISNTPKYWQNAKYEMFARLDNLGPFHFFFTLSCADLRWSENFSTLLTKLGMKIEYEIIPDGTEKTWVKDEYGKNVELSIFLKNNVDASLHEMIRTHIFIATRNYNNRVKAFIRDIVTDKNNPMHVEYWSTKVEFQGRGAGHNHGTIWVDMKKMELTFIDDEHKWADLESLLRLSKNQYSNLKMQLKEILNSYFVEGAVIDKKDAITLQNIYREIFQTEVIHLEIEKIQMNFLRSL